MADHEESGGEGCCMQEINRAKCSIGGQVGQTSNQIGQLTAQTRQPTDYSEQSIGQNWPKAGPKPTKSELDLDE